MLTHIKEETFFIYLAWIHPAFSVIIISTLLGENFLKSSKNLSSHIFYSSCSKAPLLWEDILESNAYRLFALTQLIIVLLTFCSQITIFMRQKQLETQRADTKLVVIFTNETAAISRADQYQPPCCRLWRHNRTVVTPLASLLSHLFRLVMLLLAIGSHIGPSSLRVVEQIIISTTFCSLFFLYNLIETIFSPTLRKSLIEFFVFDRSGPVYQIANI